MFRGFATVTFYADDLAAAKDWYTELLGVEAVLRLPRAARDAGVHRVQGRRRRGRARPHRPQVRTGRRGQRPRRRGDCIWHVDDLPPQWSKLLAMGATEYEARDRTRVRGSRPHRWSTRSATS